MDKIKNLLVKSGCKQELVEEICKSLVAYKTELQESLAAEQTSKLEEAKRICIEETEAHKRDLSRRVQIFCDTKSVTIESQLAKQSALNESEAEARLKSIRELVDGIESNGQNNGKVTAALEQVKRQVAIANEEKKRAVEQANRQLAIAEKVLQQNRQLTTENAQLKQRVGARPVNESRQAPARTNRIDSRRQSTAQPVSTRPTLLENQDRRQPARSAQPNVTNTGRVFGVTDIAATMDDDVV